MWHRRFALLAVLIASNHVNGDATEPGRTKFHMRERFSDLRTIERLVVANRLEEARTIAFMLSRSVTTLPQSDEAQALLDASHALGNAQSIEQAAHAEVRVARVCAKCHLAAQQLPAFRMPTQAPPDRPDVRAQMARYEWATDRLWEGLLASSDQHWRAGMYVFATSSLPHTTQTAPRVAKRLQLLAQGELDRTTAPTVEDRADTYAHVLVLCADCHARWHR